MTREEFCAEWRSLYPALPEPLVAMQEVLLAEVLEARELAARAKRHALVMPE